MDMRKIIHAYDDAEEVVAVRNRNFGMEILYTKSVSVFYDISAQGDLAME